MLDNELCYLLNVRKKGYSYIRGERSLYDCLILIIKYYREYNFNNKILKVLIENDYIKQ